MTSLAQSQTLVGLQELKPAFAFPFVVYPFVKLECIGPAPVGNGTSFHGNTKASSVFVTIKALKGFPVFRIPRGSLGKLSIPFVFEQSQVAITGNGVLIRALQKHFPIHLSAKFSSYFRRAEKWNCFFLGLPARSKLSFSCFFEGSVSCFVFGKLFRHLCVTGQIVPGPLGIFRVQDSRRIHAVHNVGGPLTLKNNGPLQMIDIGRGLNRTNKTQNGERDE